MADATEKVEENSANEASKTSAKANETSTKNTDKQKGDFFCFLKGYFISYFNQNI